MSLLSFSTPAAFVLATALMICAGITQRRFAAARGEHPNLKSRQEAALKAMRAARVLAVMLFALAFSMVYAFAGATLLPQMMLHDFVVFLAAASACLWWRLSAQLTLFAARWAEGAHTRRRT